MTAYLMILALCSPGDSTPAAVNFDTDLIPVFTKSGCNAGACHGAAIGRGGFKLSLYGSDPQADHQAIVRQLEGRRVNLARPEQSLLLMKPTGMLDHGGGYRLDFDGPGAQLIVDWLKGGARREPPRKLVRLELAPDGHVAAAIPSSVQLRAMAHFDDGSARDVTAWTVFTSSDEASVAIDAATSVAELKRRGWHVVTARYLDQVAPLELIVPLSRERISLAGTPRHNAVDDYIIDRLETLGIPASPQAGDAAFVRRVHLDLTGRLPSADAARAFLADTDEHKRARLVDALLASDEFVDYWTFRLAQLLRIRPVGRGMGKETEPAIVYTQWLRDQIASGTPLDDMARQLITAEGDTHESGPPNFYRTTAGAREQAEFVSELFMGARLRCANCHDHPLDRWTQDDYHGLAAVFATIESSGRIVKPGARGEVTHPRTGEPAVPRIPGQGFLEPSASGTGALAEWLTHQDNPYFARAMVNRFWKSLMGRGLVEPTDDMRATNQATHPELLEYLAGEFVERDYSLRHILRLVATSAAYGRGSEALAENQPDDRFYSRAVVRPLDAEVLSDAFADVTGVWDQYGSQPLGTRAIQLVDPTVDSESLDILGRCSREDTCESVLPGAGGALSTRLHLINGPLVNAKIAAETGFLHTLLGAEPSDDAVLEQLYLRCYSRLPAERERAFWRAQFPVAGDAASPDESAAERRALFEDMLWSLLSSHEFLNNQ